MNIILLTKVTTPVIGWVADLLGLIFNLLFKFTSSFDVQNIGICIILFTLIVNILMLPLTIKQQRSSKLMNIMQPELQAIQKKYKGKTDQASQQRMQAETSAVYEKYGTSMFGGCGQLLIQFPILIALYQVIYHIPGYVPAIKAVLEPVAEQIIGTGDFFAKIEPLATAVKMSAKTDWTEINNVIDFLYKLSPAQWGELSGIFPKFKEIIVTAETALTGMNTFLGVNLASAPWQGFKPSLAWLIPILAGVTQWLSVKVMPQPAQPAGGDDAANAAGNTMKTMNTMMPLMSVFFCFTLPSGIGIYWIASAVVRTVIQVVINKMLEKEDPEELVLKNLEKVNAKRAKKGLPPKTIDKKAQADAAKEERMAQMEEQRQAKRREESAKKVVDSTKYYNLNARPDSLTARANMVAMYDQRQEDARHGKKRVVTEGTENASDGEKSSGERTAE